MASETITISVTKSTLTLNSGSAGNNVFYYGEEQYSPLSGLGGCAALLNSMINHRHDTVVSSSDTRTYTFSPLASTQLLST